ncbi:MAG: type II toxin-antitoxin system RelE/ParE family toxin [Rhodoferax sp.]|uniref:type II toxin-antitoxin system RelE/ParE family toxin n=1 Tax=Rhodoferax sp. TaxID=50421 RepID=UPI0026202F72|nr:type II toxin-antitoxin system RelE/ParE family toxin [Rhodoferax sp.]MDD2882209.1 type II toxin-antitoxin system RelE/ParE family toxin [Rhodoferax sp.]
MTANSWHVRLASAAEEDYQDILQWTVDKFGLDQAHTYAETLSATIEDLCAGPEILGIKTRSEIGLGLYTLHVARKGRKGRHFLMFQVGHLQGVEVIDVLRILHDSMDLQRHLPAGDFH